MVRMGHRGQVKSACPIQGCRPYCTAVAAAAILLLTTPVRAAAIDEDTGFATESKPQWHIQLKRQNTDRGTPGESTKTTLRFESTPSDGPLTLLRLDIPFPDEKTDMTGSIFNPQLGDIKLRLGFRDFSTHHLPFASFTELTFPTANPESAGARTLQFTLGVKTGSSFSSPPPTMREHHYAWTTQVQQTVSLAAINDQVKDVNYTKFEFAVVDTWKRDYSLKGTLKPVIDWVQDGKNGAVFELEGGVNFAQGWRFSLMGGLRAWGPAVASTYNKRIEMNLGRRF